MSYAASSVLRVKPNPARKAAPSRNFFLKIGGALFLAVWTLTLLGGAWDFLFKRLLHAPAPSVTLLTLLVLALFSLRLLNRNSQMVLAVPDIVAATWVFAAFLLLSAMVNANTQSLNLVVMLLSFHVYFFYLMFFAASPLIAGSISPSTLVTYLAVLGVGMALIGLAQAAAGDLFSFGYYITASVNSINATTAGKVRASALFAHADDFGIFLCIPLAIAIWKFGTELGFSRRLLWAAMILILLGGCVATLTRAVYLSAMAVSVVTVWGVRRSRINRRALFPVWLPIALMAAGTSVFLFRYIIEAFVLNFDALKDFRYLLSSKSLDERIYGITYYVQQMNFEGWLAWMFGLGWAFNSNIKALIPIDNGFLGILVSCGVVGGALWLYLSWRIWVVINRFAGDRENPLAVPLVSFYSAWLLMCVFGLYYEPFMVAVLLVAVLPSHKLRKILPRRA
jgi:hypothetical protein